jgi:hypothetical protein
VESVAVVMAVVELAVKGGAGVKATGGGLTDIFLFRFLTNFIVLLTLIGC